MDVNYRAMIAWLVVILVVTLAVLAMVEWIAKPALEELRETASYLG